MQVQVTLLSDRGNRPVSCIVDVESREYFLSHKKEIQQKGITKICQKRYWQKRDLLNYGYMKVMMREYDKERIEKENAERYERIKKKEGGHNEK